MKTLQKAFLIVAALGLLAAAGCKPTLDLSMQRNRIFLLGRLLAGQTCDVRVIWRNAPDNATPVTVTADLSQIGGKADQELAAGDNDTWQWSGQVTPAASGERLITISTVDGQDQHKEITKRFRVFDTDKAIAIAAAGGVSLALKADGTVVAWNIAEGSRVATPSGLADVTAIAAAELQRLALKADGTVVAWGCDYYGYDLGLCDVPKGLADIVAIAANGTGSFALRADGLVVAWGQEAYVPAALTDVVAIAAGGYYVSAAVQADGTLRVWPGTATLSDAVAAAIGYGYDGNALALKSDGTIAQTITDIQGSALPLRLSTVRATAISSGEVANIALQEDGSVVEWAYRRFYHRRNKSIAVAAEGYNNFFALAEDGSVTAWQEPWIKYAVTELPVPAELQ